MGVDFEEFRGELVTNLVPIPQAGEDVCPVCHSWRYPTEELCSNCSQASLTLSRPCLAVLPITLYRKPSLVREWLKFYKPGPEGFEPSYGDLIAAILSLGLDRNVTSLRKLVGVWDQLVVVPSTERASPHPLELHLGQAGLAKQISWPLSRTQTPLSHGVMSDDGFKVAGDVKGCRFLIVDDVFTTGARSQSAASALQLAGAVVVAIVVIGRRINPEYNEIAQALWDRQHIVEFSFEGLFVADT